MNKGRIVVRGFVNPHVKYSPADAFQPVVAPITDPELLTSDYIKHIEGIVKWIKSPTLNQNERIYLAAGFRKMGVIAKYALARKLKLSFMGKDVEMLRWQMAQGEQPSVDGDPTHVLGFKGHAIFPDEIIECPLFPVFKQWFEVAEAIHKYTCKQLGVEFMYVEVSEKGGNQAMYKVLETGNIINARYFDNGMR